MNIHTINQFCDRWMGKSRRYNSEDLEDLFDKYFTLFVVYNYLYSIAAQVKIASTIHERNAMYFRGDRRQATAVMVTVIKQSRFSTLIENDILVSRSCDEISRLLFDAQFFLHNVRGKDEPDRDKDMTLAQGLVDHKLMSVLECLYQIRCNIFHGSKGFETRQAALLIPAITLLEAIISLSHQAVAELIAGYGDEFR